MTTSDYKYTDPMTKVELHIAECAWVGHVGPDGSRRGAHVTPDERPKAAQALAGDGYRVVPADTPSPDETYYADVAAYTRGETDGNPYSGERAPVDLATVQIGWVMEVEANDGTWMVRGEVTGIYPQHDDEYRFFLVDIDGHPVPVSAKVATVRVVSRPDEPDPIHCASWIDQQTTLAENDLRDLDGGRP